MKLKSKKEIKEIKPNLFLRSLNTTTATTTTTIAEMLMIQLHFTSGTLETGGNWLLWNCVIVIIGGKPGQTVQAA